MPPVLHLIDSGGFYGAERVLLELLIEIRDTAYPGVLGCFVVPGAGEPEIARRAIKAGLSVQLFPTRRGLDWKMASSLRKFVDSNDIGVVHCHGYKPNILCGFILKRTVPCISTAHGWAQGSGLKIAFYNWLDRCALKRMDCVVGVSGMMVAQLKQSGVSPARICKILNGMRMRPVGNHQSRDFIRDSYAVAPGMFVMGAVGRLAPVKGYGYLLAALRQVVERYPNCRLIIAGEGSLRPELEAQVHSLGLESFVQFLGFVDDMGELFQLIDLFVMPSLSEGLPMALLEAMAHGKACVASRVGGIPEILDGPEVGVLVPPADQDSLAKAIITLVGGSEARGMMGEKAKAVVSQRFSVQRMASDYLSLYSRIRQDPYLNRPAGITDTAST